MLLSLCTSVLFLRQARDTFLVGIRLNDWSTIHSYSRLVTMRCTRMDRLIAIATSAGLLQNYASNGIAAVEHT